MAKYCPVLLVAVAVVIVTATACGKEEACSVHPDAFRFSIVEAETGTDLLASGVYDQGSIEIWYFYNDDRNDLIVNMEENPDGNLIEMASVQLPMISLTGRSDIFYLALGEAETDTLTVVVERERRDGCDYHPYTMVKHNGNALPIIEGKAFILEK